MHPHRLAALFVPCALLLGACYAQSSHVVKVRKMVREGEYERALYQTKRYLEKAPDDRDLLKLMLHIHFAQDQRKEAVTAYAKRAAAGKPDKVVARYLGLLMLRWGMEHREPAVRLDAVQGARSTDASPLAPDMVERLSDDDGEVRTWAAVAMSRSPQGAEVLEEQLTAKSPAARAVAVEQVGRIAGCKAASALLPHVKDSHQRVRAAAARALSYCKRKEMLPHLEALLKDGQWQVRAAAARAVASLGYRQGAAALVPLLQNDGKPGVKLAALDALATLDEDRARPLLEKLVTERTWLTALRAGVLLSRAGKAQPGIEAVARALVAGKPTDRAAACNAASQIKDPVAAEQAKRALADADALVRLAAGRALAAHKRGVEALEMAQALHRKACPAEGASTDLCLQAAELMALLGQPAGAATMERLAREATDATLRRRALSLVLRHRPSLDRALAAMADVDARVAVAAAVWFYSQVK